MKCDGPIARFWCDPILQFCRGMSAGASNFRRWRIITFLIRRRGPTGSDRVPPPIAVRFIHELVRHFMIRDTQIWAIPVDFLPDTDGQVSEEQRLGHRAGVAEI